MSRPITTILIEAFIIGIMNLVLVTGLEKIHIPLIPLIAGALIISYSNTPVVTSGGAHRLTQPERIYHQPGPKALEFPTLDPRALR